MKQNRNRILKTLKRWYS